MVNAAAEPIVLEPEAPRLAARRGIARRSVVSWIVAALPPLAVAAIVAANGWPGLLPGVAFWDTAEFQVIAPVLGTGHSPGFPTYVLVGFVANLLLTPLGEPAFRMNAFSLLTVAAAAALLMIFVRRLGVPTLIAGVAGFGMATTALVWLQATHAEPHTLHLAFVGLLFLLLVEWGRRRRLEIGREPDGLADVLSDVGPPGEGGEGMAVVEGRATLARVGTAGGPADRWLVAAAIVFGLAAGNHGLTFILAPAIVLYVLVIDRGSFVRPRLIAACAVASVGTLVLTYLELPLRAGVFRAPVVYGTPDTWDGFWYVALATQFHGLISDPLSELPAKLGDLVALTGKEFGALAVFIPLGLIAAVRIAPAYAVLSGASMVITLFWNSFFNDGYIDRYYLGPIFWAWTWLALLGALIVARLAEVLPRATSNTGRRLIAAAVAVALLVPGFADWTAKATAADRQDDASAARWLDEVLPVMAPDALVVSWWSTSTALWYAQAVEGRRTDVFVADDRTMLDLELGRAPDVIDACLGLRPVYALRANDRDLGELLAQFDMTRVASSGSLGLYEVRARMAGVATGPGRCPGVNVAVR